MSEKESRMSLEHLHLHLAGPASLECRGCQVLPKLSQNGGGHRPFLPLETILRAVDEALPLGLKKVRLCGGESFRYPAWDALLDALQQRDLHVIVETDGSGLTAERAARLARLPHAAVIFGWTGADPAAQAAGQPSLAMDAIRLLAAHGITIRIIAPVTRHMLGQIPDIIRVAEQSGAKSIRFTTPPPPLPMKNGPAQPAVGSSNGAANGTAFGSANGAAIGFFDGAAFGYSNGALSVEEAIAVGRKVERDLAKSTLLRLVFDQPPAFRGLFPQARVEGQGYCNVFNRLSILPDGTVALCGAAGAIPDLVFGKIDPQGGQPGLEEIWRSHPMLVSLRAGMPARLEGICAHCIMQTACMGYCIAENYLRSGSFYGPNWFCQSAEQAGLFPAGRIIENAW